jgi:hypothetical protein
MSAHFIQTLEMNREEVVTHCSSEYLAILDLDSYPSFIGEKADRLDLMAHLQDQMCALTAVAWGGPGKALRIRLLLSGDNDAVHRVTRSCHMASASGWVRTQGRLCLTGHDRLFDCARHAGHTILKGGRLLKDGRSRILNVPPGTYEVLVYFHSTLPEGDRLSNTSGSDPKADYTVVLHHYPFPTRRVVPVRLPGFDLRPEEEAAEPPAGTITSHSKWDNYVSIPPDGRNPR